MRDSIPRQGEGKSNRKEESFIELAAHAKEAPEFVDDFGVLTEIGVTAAEVLGAHCITRSFSRRAPRELA